MRAPEGSMIHPQRIKGGTGFAAVVPEGGTLRIVDVFGKQVGDLVLFCTEDPSDRFSQANTRKLENTIYLGVGSRLWSTTCRPLARIDEDCVGRHDILSSACSPYDYPVRFGIENHRSCLTNLTESLVPFGISESMIPDPMNVFMRQELSPQGTLTVLEPLSRAGSFIELSMLAECIVAISACPQDQNPCNGFEISDLELEVIPSGSYRLNQP